GKIVGAGRREIRIDINGLSTGVIRGRELFTESAEYGNLKTGTEVEATVIELENENGEMELSFRFAGQKKAWEELQRLFTTNECIDVKIMEANKGGLIVAVQNITGFLPVSQLSPEHYPRVSGGDKNKILEKLRSYVGSKMNVRVIDVNESEEKLIVSEKTVWEDTQKNVISKYQIGNTIEGEVTAVADFGAFVKFSDGGTGDASLEGLVHISEIAWQRIDHPRDLLRIGQTVKAEIIGIEGSKIFLSMKKLIKDPWADVAIRYKIGEMVEGTVLKVNPFGLFVELDSEIHGLAHVSELSDKPVTNVTTIAKPGDRMSFKIVSIEPKEHRLGLSLKTETTSVQNLEETSGSQKEETPVGTEPDSTGEVAEAKE
ncbi:MAG: S1 RNA-binding domain-containing protein, partial [Patescibacteria group bacterium]